MKEDRIYKDSFYWQSACLGPVVYLYGRTEERICKSSILVNVKWNKQF